MILQLTLTPEAAAVVKRLFSNGELSDVGVEHMTEVLEHEVIREGEDSPSLSDDRDFGHALRSERKLHRAVQFHTIDRDRIKPDGTFIIVHRVPRGTIEDVLLVAVHRGNRKVFPIEGSDIPDFLRRDPPQYSVDIFKTACTVEVHWEGIEAWDMVEMHYYFRD